MSGLGSRTTAPTRFYLGTHMPNWLGKTEVPLFISRVRLLNDKTGKPKKRLPEAIGPWALDSGGFMALKKNGQWNVTVAQYIGEVKRYDQQIGRLQFVAPMDWMCEPEILKKTGLTVQRHQELTVNNFLRLRANLGNLVIPVLQGWELDDYMRCWELYERAHVDLSREFTVGVGSICRRGQDNQIVKIMHALRPLRMHAFGVRTDALARCAHFLQSADSMAWSYEGRRTPRRPGCVHPRGGKSEANCMRFALDWRARQPAVNRTRMEIAA